MTPHSKPVLVSLVCGALLGCPQPIVDPLCALVPCDASCFSQCAGDAGSSAECTTKVNQCLASFDGGSADAGGSSDGGSTDAGVDAGSGTALTGSLAFEVRTGMSFGRRLDDGGTDLTVLGVLLTSEVRACPQSRFEAVPGPGRAIGLEATGTPAKGLIQTPGTGSYAYLIELNPDGGRPELAENLIGSYTLDYPGADLSRGVTGTLSLTSNDGGTLQGSFTARYCGAY